MKSLKLSTINKKGELTGEEIVSGKVLENEFSPLLLVQAAKVFLSNQRKALAKTKTRSLVLGSKSKIYKQKGTGRARHGDRQAPIFVGGGVSHGPTGYQNYKKSFNQKMTKNAILKVLVEKIAGNKAFLTKGLDLKKTKEASLFINKAKENLKLKGKIALLFANENEVKRAFRNLDEMTILNVKSMSPYELVNFDNLLITEEAFGEIKTYLNIDSKAKTNEKSN
jgi:large subunit ribosomal protein L4